MISVTVRAELVTTLPWKVLHRVSGKGSTNGAEGARTPDLCNANAALSQLSYSPMKQYETGGQRLNPGSRPSCQRHASARQPSRSRLTSATQPPGNRHATATQPPRNRHATAYLANQPTKKPRAVSAGPIG